MREYMGLYRGKRICNGKWMEGYLLRLADGTCLICQAGYRINRYKVDPNSVGECTSLRDENGKLIFEGDILRLGGHDLPHWMKKGQKCEVEYNAGGFVPLSDYDSDCGDYVVAGDCEIIGNIHDNPELLKGGEGDG